MSINIDLYVYDKEKLISLLVQHGARGDWGLLVKILEACGLFSGDKYILLNNEYYESSPYYAVAALIDAAFGIEDSFSVFLYDEKYDTGKEAGVNYVEAEDVAEELGFTLDGDGGGE